MAREVSKLQDQNRRLSENSALVDWPNSPQVTFSASPTTPTFDEIPSLESVPSLSSSRRTSSLTSRGSDSTVSFTNESTVYIETIAQEPRAKLFGVDLLRQLCNLCYSLPRHGESYRHDSAMKIVHALDAPVPTSRSEPPVLPPSDTLFLWVELAFSEALPLWDIVDKAYVYNIITCERPSTADECIEDNLALLYSVLALGQRLEISENGPSERRLQGQV